jgi:hypothetical protein
VSSFGVGYHGGVREVWMEVLQSNSDLVASLLFDRAWCVSCIPVEFVGELECSFCITTLCTLSLIA